MTRRLVAVIAAVVLAGTFGGTATAQQRAEPDEHGDVPTVVRETDDLPTYVPLPWEVAGLTFPILDHHATVEATGEDNSQLVFLDGSELGSFRPAPIGGTPFFGSGQPIFGMAAPPVLPTRVLRPLGDGDAGDSFLGGRPPLDAQTVIPKFRETFDSTRESFAFIGGIPPIPETSFGSTAFPLLDVVAADPTPGCRDNDPTCEPEPPATPPTTVPTTPTTLPTSPVTTAPLPAPGPAGPAPTVPPATTPTTTPPPTTTVPPLPTPTTAPPVGTTTTTVRPTTTTTTPATTTTTRPTTTTTTRPTTTTTTAPAPVPDPGTPSAAFVLANRVADDVDHSSANLCLSNAVASNRNEDCDRLFNFGSTADGRDGFMQLGEEYAVNLTLWNIPNPSTIDAVSLKGYARSACTSTPTPADDGDSLCQAVMLKIERFSDPGRQNRIECVYGGASCEFDASKNLFTFGEAYDHSRVNPQGVSIGDDFPLGHKAYLKITVNIADSGLDNGIGADNHLINQEANLVFRWEMQSA